MLLSTVHINFRSLIRSAPSETLRRQNYGHKYRSCQSCMKLTFPDIATEGIVRPACSFPVLCKAHCIHFASSVRRSLSEILRQKDYSFMFGPCNVVSGLECKRWSFSSLKLTANLCAFNNYRGMPMSYFRCGTTMGHAPVHGVLGFFHSRSGPARALVCGYFHSLTAPVCISARQIRLGPAKGMLVRSNNP